MNDQFHDKTKAVVTVAEMARMLGLSRARFYQLIGTAFPEPSRDEQTKRPFYDEDQQKACLEVRKRNCGVDGKPILFYARRGGAPSSPKPKAKANKAHVGIIEAVRSLGLLSMTAVQIESAIRILFPKGIDGVEHAEVIRTVFIHLQRQNSSDKVG